MAESLTQQIKEPSFLDKILSFGTAALQMRSQDQIRKIQLQRAAAGQPLLDVEKLAPPVRATVGLSSETGGIAKTALYIGGGLAAAYLLAKVLKRR